MDKTMRAVVLGVGLLVGVWVVAHVPAYLDTVKGCDRTCGGSACESMANQAKLNFEAEWRPGEGGKLFWHGGVGAFGHGPADMTAEMIKGWPCDNSPPKSISEKWCREMMSRDSANMAQRNFDCVAERGRCQATVQSCKAAAWRAFFPQ